MTDKEKHDNIMHRENVAIPLFAKLQWIV